MPLDIMGIQEIADRIGKPAQHVAVMHNRDRLPPHDAEINGGRTKVWRRWTIEKWIHNGGTK